MKNNLGIFGFVLLGFILQTTFAVQVLLAIVHFTGMEFLAGHTVDFALVILVYLAVHRKRSTALIWGLVIGIMTGWFGTAWRGVAAVSFFGVALTGTLLSRHIFFKGFGMSVLLVAGFSVLEGILHLQVGYLLTRVATPFFGQMKVLLTQAMLNALVAPFVLWFLDVFDHWTGASKPFKDRSLEFTGI